jgi:hypothetical protein
LSISNEIEMPPEAAYEPDFEFDYDAAGKVTIFTYWGVSADGCRMSLPTPLLEKYFKRQIKRLKMPRPCVGAIFCTEDGGIEIEVQPHPEDPDPERRQTELDAWLNSAKQQIEAEQKGERR